MRTDTWLVAATKQLQQHDIATARLDSLLLLEFITQHDRAWLLAHPEHQLRLDQSQRLADMLDRRSQHEPIAHLRGISEFYGRQFVVSADVLEPRPESETMIDLLKQLCVFTPPKQADRTTKSDQLNNPQNLFLQTKLANFARKVSGQDGATIAIADVGAGSGALGITASFEVPQCHVDLLEIDPQARKTSQTNVDFLTSSATVRYSDLLKHTTTEYDVLLCNLPYVPDDYPINKAAEHEPAIALFGGTDGLDLYRRLFKELLQTAAKPLYILTEALPDQHPTLAAIGTESGYHVVQTNDFIQVFQAQK